MAEEIKEEKTENQVEETAGKSIEQVKEETTEQMQEKTADVTVEKKLRLGKIAGRVFAVLLTTLVMFVIALLCVMLVLTKGPSTEVRNLFVLSVRESSAGGFLASIYLSPEEIAAIEAENLVEDSEEVTDTSIVTIATKEERESASSEEEASFIVETDFDTKVYVENGIEFHEIAGATFTGRMLIVADPARVFVGTPYEAYDGRPGLDVPTICDRYDAIAAINGAFFEDTNGAGDGGTPLGFVFSEGEQRYGGDSTEYNMMGFNKDGVLICGKMTGAQAKEKEIRDGVTCNPFLVINGEGLNVAGSGGGLNPRTALGQRSDGAVLLLTVDGRQATSLGATMSDMVDVMLAFGAVNAGNLDGGGSTVVYYDKKVLNVVMSIYGTRGVPNAFCVKKEQ